MAVAATTISGLYSTAQRLKLEVGESLEQLERLESFANYAGYGGSGARLREQALTSSPDLSQSLRLKLAELQRIRIEMDRMWRSQVNKSQRDIWKRKVEHVAEETDALNKGLDKFLQRESGRQREARERAELLERTSGDNGRVLSEMEAERRDLETARNAARTLEETIQTGFSTLRRMAEQREILKGAQRRALDALNFLGISDTLLKRINRRHRIDRWLSLGGMLLTLIIVFSIWRLTRS